MEKITKKELKTILEQHTLWLDSNKKEGKRADLSGANLSGADLRYANLIRSILIDTDLTGANLTGAKLYGAYLTGADLTGAILTNATLAGADLYDANLFDANLFDAILTDTDLTCADLTGANLYGAKLYGANLTDTILDEKEQCRKGVMLTEPMTGYKKAYEGKIITLEIPIGAKVFSIHNDKRRTNKVKVIDMQGETELSSICDTDFKYRVGDEINIIDFDDNYNVECGEGIHFFLTRDEAKIF